MKRHVAEALKIIKALGLPRAQQNERSALSLLALVNLTPTTNWCHADSPLIGITPIMEWMSVHYGKTYKPNSRETVRRQTMHQFVEAGIACYNPDSPGRPVNSPDAVYQIAPAVLEVLKTYETKCWASELSRYLTNRVTLAEMYAMPRKLQQIPVRKWGAISERLPGNPRFGLSIPRGTSFISMDLVFWALTQNAYSSAGGARNPHPGPPKWRGREK